MNLYRKIRPKTFDQVLGNDASIESLERLIKKGDSQVFVISGDSGCGKTTLARIAAHELGADDLSIKEINSSDNRGIDTAREIREDLKYKVADGSAKVIIIDEAHGITTDFKRAMLKPLEDTPPNVYFFLCTTNVKKLFQGDEGRAIKTRAKLIEVKPLKPDLIIRLLKKTVRAEEFEIDNEVLEEIAHNCEGSPRQALELLEQISVIEDKKTQLKVIDDGGDVEAETKELFQALLGQSSWKEIAKIIKKIPDIDPERMRYAVLGWMNAVLLSGGKQAPQAAWIIECFAEPFYNMGKSGLTLACWQSVNEEDE